MAFASMEDGSGDQALAEINMVPLIDVMLVLLVIFIVAAPLLTHSVNVDLPKAAAVPERSKPDDIQLAIDRENRLYWNGEPIARDALAIRLHEAAVRLPQPELHLRAERTTAYEKVADVMAAAARAGLTRIGFVTEPHPNP